jgi:hypothetical protein
MPSRGHREPKNREHMTEEQRKEAEQMDAQYAPPKEESSHQLELLEIPEDTRPAVARDAMITRKINEIIEFLNGVPPEESADPVTKHAALSKKAMQDEDAKAQEESNVAQPLETDQASVPESAQHPEDPTKAVDTARGSV